MVAVIGAGVVVVRVRVIVVPVVVRVDGAPVGGRLRGPAPPAEQGDEAVQEEPREREGGDEPEGERHGVVSLTTSAS